MDAQQFLAEFGHMANAPGGAARLRELILQLAVQGKLIAASESDLSTRILLDEVRAIKADLVSCRKLPREKPFPEVLSREVNANAPSHWRWVRFGEIWQLLSGRDLEPSQYNDSNNGIPYITGASNLENGVITVSRWTPDPVVVSVTGDLLITCKGTIGKTAFNTLGDIHIARQIMAARNFSGKLDTGFLKIWLDSFVGQLVEKSKSMIPGFSRDDLVLAAYPVLPIEEQARIVAKVDELMALCDKLETQQKARRKLQNNLRQSTLQAVASATSPHELQTSWARLADNFGRLFHAPEDLIDFNQCIKQLALKGLLSVWTDGERVNSEIAELARFSTALVPDAEMDWSIPDHLIWARCAWLGEARLGKMLDAAKNKGDFRPYLRNINVRWGKFELSGVLQMRIEKHELSKVSVRKGDLVICEGGEPGRSAVWYGEEEFVIQKALHRFRCNEYVLPEYILFCLEHDYFSGRLSRYFTGATIKHLTGRALAEYPIPLPPVDEQRRILVAVDELIHSVATLKERLIARNRYAAALAAASVASLTGIAIEQEEPMQAPQIENAVALT